MSAIQPPENSVTRVSGLTISTVVFSALGMALWGTSIGFLFGYFTYLRYTITTLISLGISIPTNAAMIYVSCRLVFIVMNRSFPSAATLQDLHQSVARMVAFTVVGFSAWVTSVVWLADEPGEEFYILYHACNYGFVISALVAGLAGGLLRMPIPNDRLPITAAPPKFVAQHAQVPQTHYNQAYAHQYQHQGM